MNLKRLSKGIWFPWIVSGIILATFLGTFFFLHEFSATRHREAEADDLRYLTGLAQSCFSQHLDGLALESELATQALGQTALFSRLSEATHRIFPDFLAIAWINSDATVDQVYPLESNHNLLGSNLSQHKSAAVRNAVTRAMAGKLVVNTPPIVLDQGGMGMMLFIPQIQGQNTVGLISGIFRFDDFLDVCLRNTPEFFRRLNIQHQGADLLRRAPIKGAILLRKPMKLGDLDMQLTLQHTPPGSLSASMIAHYTILVLGFLVSAIIALLLRRSESLRRLARENEDAIEQLYDQIHVAIYIVQDGRIRRPNKTASLMTGYTAEELIGVSIVDLLHPDDLDEVVSNFQKRVSGAMNLPTSYEIRLINKSGDTVWAHLETGLISWRGTPATLNVLRDITEVKTLQAQVIEAERMEIQGLMASGLAHDFNNILTGIGGCTEMLLMDHIGGSDDDETVQMLRSIQKQIASASNLTKQLLGLASGSANKTEILDLSHLIGGTMALFQRTHKGIRCDFKNLAVRAAIDADKGQIEQILLNLLVNADNALLGKGKILLMLDQVTIDVPQAQQMSIATGKYYRFVVEDSGPGIPSDMRQKIFRPFFTHSTGGKKGTGLGLASGYSIARKHGGCLQAADPQHLPGARMELFLSASPASAPEKKVPPMGQPLRAKYVAIVDDEDGVRKTLCGLLQRHGCTTVDFARGDAFIDWVGSAKDLPEVVVLDMIMPDMDGADVFRALREINYEIPVLIATGFARDDLVKSILSQANTDLIRKPFAVAELIAAINDLISKN